MVQIGLGKRVQVRRARGRQWTARRERRFLAALAATRDVALAAASVGMAPNSAFRHRALWPGFAAGWRAAVRERHPGLDFAWIEAAECFFERREPPGDNPVRITSVGEVLRMLQREDPEWRGGRGGPRRRSRG